MFYDDANPCLYRRAGFDGMPISDPRPQDLAKTDLYLPGNYVDMLTLQVRISTSEFFVGLVGGSLALMARRRMQQELWSDISGVAPGKQPDRPFGPCWTSSLSPTLVRVSREKQRDASCCYRPDPDFIYVTDETGFVHRFVVLFPEDGPVTFFAQPNSEYMHESYVPTLTASGDGFLFTRKYGNEIYFEETGVTRSVRWGQFEFEKHEYVLEETHQYFRAGYVRDRFGSQLDYDYPAPQSLIPRHISGRYINSVTRQKITIFTETYGSEVRISRIGAPNGYAWTFEYETVNCGEWGDVACLARVIPPAVCEEKPVPVSVYGYQYSEVSANGQFPVNDEEDFAPRTHHLVVQSIRESEKENEAYQFNYTPSATDGLRILRRCGGAPPVLFPFVANQQPLVISSIVLPTGAVTRFFLYGRPFFNRCGEITGARITQVVNNTGNSRVYDFGRALGVVARAWDQYLTPLYDPEDPCPWIRRLPVYTYYNQLTITYLEGSEIELYAPTTDNCVVKAEPIFTLKATSNIIGKDVFEFELTAGHSLKKLTDFSGMITEFEYGDTDQNPFPVPPIEIIEEVCPYLNYADPVSQTNADSTSRSFKYATAWQLIDWITDEINRETEFGVDGYGRVTKSEVRASGSATPEYLCLYEYSGTIRAFVTKETIKGGTGEQDIVTHYKPDKLGFVESVIRGELETGLKTVYRRNMMGAAIEITNPKRFTTFQKMDSWNRIQQITYPNGAVSILHYNARGLLSRETFSGRGDQFHEYDALGNPTISGIIIEGGQRLQSETLRDPMGRIAGTKDPRGNTTAYEYDAMNRLDRVIRPLSGVIRYLYESELRPGSIALAGLTFQPTEIQHLTQAVRYRYDECYRLTTTSRQVKNDEWATVVVELDDAGRPVKITPPVGSDIIPVPDTMDRIRRVDFTNDVAPFATYIERDYARTGLLKGQKDECGQWTNYEYDSYGRMTDVNLPPVDGVRANWHFGYDENSNVNLRRDPLEREWTFEHNNVDQQIRAEGPAVAVPPSGEYQRPVLLQDYDMAGNCIQSTDANGNKTDCFYDLAGRPVLIEAPEVKLGGSSDRQRPKSRMIYDACSNVIRQTDPVGVVSSWVYDAENRLLSERVGAEPPVVYDYDDFGNTRSVQVGASITKFGYDGLNRLTLTTDPLGKKFENKYNTANLTETVNQSAQSTVYAYDQRNRVRTVTTPETVRTLIRDAMGRLLNVDDSANPAANVAYLYDAVGRLTHETSSGLTHFYQYNPSGFMDSATFAMDSDSEFTVAYTPDHLNRVRMVTPTGLIPATEVAMDYDLNGNLKVRRTGAESGYHSKVTMNYDENNRLESIVAQRLAAGGSFVSDIHSCSQGYDLAGNVTNVDETVAGIGRREMTLTMVNGRLASELIVNNSSQRYVVLHSYDGNGNRVLRRTRPMNPPFFEDGTRFVQEAWAYNAANQMTEYVKTSTVGSGGTAVSRLDLLCSYVYDARGNRTEETKSVPDWTAPYTFQYEYDSENRLKLHVGYGTRQFQYDYRSRQIFRWIGDGLQEHVSFAGGTSVIENSEYDGIVYPEERRTYLRGAGAGGIGSILAVYRGADSTQTAFHDFYNWRGDVVVQTNAAKQVTWSAKYDAFGKVLTEQGTNPDPQRSNTKDAVIPGLVNEGFRFRDLESGMFISKDPAGFVDGPNLYNYVSQNPWSKVDPEGLNEVDVHEFLTRYLAYHAGFDYETARQIGEETQKLDDPHDPRDAMAGGLGINWDNMIRYHFVSRYVLFAKRRQAFGEEFNSRLIGEYFHALQDTFAHSTGKTDRNWNYYRSLPGGAFGKGMIPGWDYEKAKGVPFPGFGHGAQGHEPDWTWMYPEKSMKMAKEVYDEMVKLAATSKRATRRVTPWDDIKGTIDKFVQTIPETNQQVMFGSTIPVKTVSFEGYNKKIKILDPKFEMRKILGQTYGSKDVKTWWGAALDFLIENYPSGRRFGS